MMELVSRLFRWIKINRGKIALSLASLFAFLFLLFPFDELTDLISSQVSKATQNQVYLQFDELDLSLLPTPEVEMGQIRLETRALPTVQIQNLLVAPSLSALLYQQPYGNVIAQGILDGTIRVQMSKGTDSGNGLARQRVQLQAEKLNLKDLRELAKLPILLKGRMNFEGQALADLSFQEQPEMDINLTIQQFEIPPSNVNTPMGPLTLPDLRLSQVSIKGKLSGGSLNIESGTLGNANDELSGSIRGSIRMNLQNMNGSIKPQFGGYDLTLDLSAKKSFQDKAGLFLGFVDSYKRPTADGAQYRFKIVTNNPQMPPQFSSVQ
ncbi:MAG: type II secretion system protein GspN [Bdellovibrionia bacterium]